METQRIPLFPLNVVLFPGMALPLHIFEPLYRQMIRRCLDGDQRFGVCLIRSGPEVGGPADPHSVGSLCQIAHVHALEDGRMNLLVVGVSRFQVVRLYHDEAYLEGDVTEVGDEPHGELGALPTEVRSGIQRFVRRILTLSGQEPQELEFPDDPVALSFQAAALLQCELPTRQELLETRDTESRLRRGLELLRGSLEKVNSLVAARSRVAVPFRASKDRICLN